MFFNLSVSALKAAVSDNQMASFITMNTAANDDRHSSKTRDEFMMNTLGGFPEPCSRSGVPRLTSHHWHRCTYPRGSGSSV